MNLKVRRPIYLVLNKKKWRILYYYFRPQLFVVFQDFNFFYEQWIDDDVSGFISKVVLKNSDFNLNVI